jgi:hypothetical protein
VEGAGRGLDEVVEAGDEGVAEVGFLAMGLPELAGAPLFFADAGELVVEGELVHFSIRLKEWKH